MKSQKVIFFLITETARLPGTELGIRTILASAAITKPAFEIERIAIECSEQTAFRGGSQRAVSVIFEKWPFAISSRFSPLWQKQPFNFSDVLHKENYSSSVSKYD